MIFINEDQVTAVDSDVHSARNVSSILIIIEQVSREMWIYIYIYISHQNRFFSRNPDQQRRVENGRLAILYNVIIARSTPNLKKIATPSYLEPVKNKGLDDPYGKIGYGV